MSDWFTLNWTNEIVCLRAKLGGTRQFNNNQVSFDIPLSSRWLFVTKQWSLIGKLSDKKERQSWGQRKNKIVNSGITFTESIFKHEVSLSSTTAMQCVSNILWVEILTGTRLHNHLIRQKLIQNIHCKESIHISYKFVRNVISKIYHNTAIYLTFGQQFLGWILRVNRKLWNSTLVYVCFDITTNTLAWTTYMKRV